MSKRVLLIGSGQIGSRHLQAIVCLKEIDEIIVVDSNAQALSLAQARVKDVADRNEEIKILWKNILDESIPAGDICILATSAKGRLNLIKQVFDRGYTRFLVEKMVSQSLEEYQEILSFMDDNHLKCWVHCQSRTFDSYKFVKDKLKPNEPIVYSHVGGNFGLACNGIHYVDLFLYYDESKEIISTVQKIDPVLHPSKRGKDIYDLSGSLFGVTEKQSRFFLTLAADHMEPPVLTLMSPGYTFVVDELQRRVTYKPHGGEWQIKVFDDSTFVSQTSKKIVADILVQDECELPDLNDAAGAHQYIFSVLKPYFERLLKKDLAYCPTT